MDGKRCFVVGAGPIAISCSEILLEHGYSIGGIVTREQALQSWARRRHLPQRNFGEGLPDFLRAEPFDYLFSIFNVHILPPEILDLPRRGGINYHDSLLPRYAGLYAPSWAILNRERSHGITWHRMVGQVDGGEILLQRSFEIFPEDTALTLNQRCFEAATATFAKLVAELANLGLTGKPQDLSQRTYFKKQQRPEAACTLDFNQSAEALVALVRAVDFGPFRNPFGLAKFAVEDGFIGVKEATIVPSSSPAAPGTVISIDQERLVIATSTLPVSLGGFTTLEGRPLSRHEVQNGHRLAKGDGSIELRREERKLISEVNGEACIHEAFWMRRLRSVKLLTWGERFPSKAGGAPDEVRVKWAIPLEVDRWLAGHEEAGFNRKLFLLAALGGYLARVQWEECFDVSFSIETTRLSSCRGLFARRVPFRFSVDRSADFISLLGSTRGELANLERRQTYSRDLVAREPDLRGKSELPELDRAFTVHLAESLPGHEGLDGEILAIWFPEHGEEGSILFDRNRLEEASLQREIRQYTNFLSSLATRPNEPLARAALLSAEERSRLLPTVETSSTQDGGQGSLQGLFEAQVARSPHAVALEWGNDQLTYDELNQDANELAHRLRGAGIGPEEIVGIYVKRSLQAVTALWAVLKSGGAFLPLDPSAPKAHTASILRDARPKVVLATPDSVPDLHAMGFSPTWMDVNPPLRSESRIENPTPWEKERGLAYVIYTSGSTGRPKGVMVEHGSLSNFCRAAKDRFELSARDRVLQFSPLCFDASIEEIFPCLLAGGTLVLRTEEMIQSPARFLQACKACSITLLDIPTVYWVHLTKGMEREGLTLPPAIRMVITGGEAVNFSAVRTWRKVLNIKVPLLNTYGPTEATVTAIWCDLAQGEIVRSSHAAVPIGKPLPNVGAYVLDEYLEPVPVGAVGELCLAGKGLARGYLNREDLTAERFVQAWSENGAGPRLYRTGDKVRYRPDGNLEFLGRLDHQVKIRGFRVEVEEIEASLLELPEVESSCVVAKTNSRGEQSLHAYVTVRNARATNPAACRERLREKLPDYMVPAEIVLVDALPKTTAGKVDRRALQSRDCDETEKIPSGQPPLDKLEAALVEIWRDVLQKKEIGTRDNFFELGGHSLLAIALTSRMSRFLNQEIPLNWVFHSPTIEEIARTARSLPGTRTHGSAPNRNEEAGESGRLFLGPTSQDFRGGRSRPGPAWWKHFVKRERSEHVVPLRTGGGQSPLFVLPGGWVGGNELVIFAAMLPYLPAELPVYGLKEDFSTRSNRVQGSVAAIARNYWVEIRKVQPKGPYHLLAECVSSVIALEMALQVRQAGESVDRLILLDPRLMDKTKLQDENFYRELPRDVKRYYSVLARKQPVRHRGPLFVLAPEGEVLLRTRLSQWKAFQPEDLVISRMPGDHFSYIREHREAVARKIGEILVPECSVDHAEGRPSMFAPVVL